MKHPVGEKIQTYRRKAGMTQEQLGRRLGVTGQAVSKWETGESLPDILLLPELCAALAISADALLEVPYIGGGGAAEDFCAYARERGREPAVLDVLSRLYKDNGMPLESQGVSFHPAGLRAYDPAGMGFVVSREDYLRSCLEPDGGHAAYLLRILTEEAALSLLRRIRLDKAVTRTELMEGAALEEEAVLRALCGLMKRGIVVCGRDADGKRGYLLGPGMAGILMALAGCRLLDAEGRPKGWLWFSRERA